MAGTATRAATWVEDSEVYIKNYEKFIQENSQSAIQFYDPKKD